MRGLEDWRFPIEAAAIDGDEVLVKWRQVVPGGRSPDRHLVACATPAAAASTTRRTC